MARLRWCHDWNKKVIFFGPFYIWDYFSQSSGLKKLKFRYFIYTFNRLQLEDIDEKNEIVKVPPEEVVAEKQTLISKLQQIDKKEETVDIKKEMVVKQEVPVVVKKVEVNTVFKKNLLDGRNCLHYKY